MKNILPKAGQTLKIVSAAVLILLTGEDAEPAEAAT